MLPMLDVTFLVKKLILNKDYYEFKKLHNLLLHLLHEKYSKIR